MAFIGMAAGLGNPGSRYADTLHNCGFMLCRKLLATAHAERAVETLPGKRFNAELYAVSLPGLGGKWLVAMPQTFMNASGRAIQPLLAWYRLKPQNLVVFQDELDLPPGSIRFKFGGGMAGHNGLASITEALGTTDYYRLRIGVGHPAQKGAVIDWVLGKPSAVDRQKIERALTGALETFFIFCRQGRQEAARFAREFSAADQDAGL